MKVFGRINYLQVLIAILTIFLCSVSGLMAQQNSAAPNQDNARESSQSIARGYQIGSGDVLDIRMLNKPQLSRDAVRVDERGTIILPLIGYVRAQCKTERDLAREIAELYLPYQNNPQVDVFVKDYQSQSVAVIGAVRTPGRFQMQRPVRLVEMLSFVGGPTDRAGQTLQIIHNEAAAMNCDESKTPTASLTTTAPADNVVIYQLRDTMSGNYAANPFVRPGDIITILDADQVYIVGNVLRPMALPLTESLTVSRAIAMAGGLMPDTKADKVRIVRQLPGATGKQEILVDLKAIDKRNAEDVALRANDIVDVPVSGSKRFLRDLMSIVAPTVGSLPVRVIR